MSTKLAADRAIKQMMREQRNHAFTNRKKTSIDIDIQFIIVLLLCCISFGGLTFSTYNTFKAEEIRIIEGID